MKLKRVLSAILIYLLFLNLLPLNLVNAYAETTEETYSFDKYYDFHQLYQDCAIVAGGNSLSVLKNGQITQYALDGNFETYAGRKDNYVYLFSTQTQSPDYKRMLQLEKINITNGLKTVSKIGIPVEGWVEDAKLDADDNSWVSIADWGNYRLLKIDGQGLVKKNVTNINAHYTTLMDDQGNVWTSYKYYDRTNEKDKTEVFELVNDKIVKSYSFDDRIYIYNVSNSGDMWFEKYTDKGVNIIRIDSEKNILNTFPVDYYPRDIQVDSNGNTWMLKSQWNSGTSEIQKLERGTFVTKLQLDYTCSRFRVIDDHSISVQADNGSDITIFNLPYDRPTVISTNPSRNSKNVPGNSDIKITFNENVKPGANYGLISLFRQQNYKMITYDTDTKIDGDTITIKPRTILPGGQRFYVYVPEGAATNDLGDKTSAEYYFAFTTLQNKDKIAPKVNSSAPKSGSKDVWIAPEALFVHFSEDIAEGVNFENIKLVDKDNSPVECEKQLAADTLIVKPSQEFNYGMSYSLLITKDSITDLSGNEMSKDYNMGFTTFAKPSVSKINIKSTNVKLDTKIQVDFTQNIYAFYDANELITVIKNSSNEKIYISDITTKGKSMYIQLSKMLDPNTDYTLTIPKDAIIETNYYNCGLEKDYSQSFKTEDKEYPLKVLTATPGKNEKDIKTSDNIEIKFNKPITQGDNYTGITLNNLKAKNAADKKINYAAAWSISGKNSDTLVINPTGLAENTTYILKIPDGAVKDAKNAALKGNFTLSFTTAASAAALSVKSSIPKNNATSVKIYDPIKIAFNRKVELKEGWDNGSKTGLEISYPDSNGNKCIVDNANLGVYAFGDTLYIINFFRLDYNKKYTVKLSKDFVVDMTGKSMANDYTFSYTSEKDKYIPYLVDSNPYNYEYDVPSSSDMEFEFNEALSTYDTKYITVQSHKNEKIAVSSDDVSITGPDNDKLLISLGDKIKENTRYIVTLKPGAVKDLADNKSTATYILTFITSNNGAQLEEVQIQNAQEASPDNTINQKTNKILEQFKAAHKNPTLDDINNLILQLSGSQE